MGRQDAQTIDRTAAAMETLLESGVSQVNIRRVLQLLGRPIPEPARAQEVRPVLDPRADPLTGCLPVTAQGGTDDHDSEEDRGVPREEGHGQQARGFRGFRA